MQMENNVEWTKERFHTYAFFASLYLEEPTMEKWLTIQKLSNALLFELDAQQNSLTIPEDREAAVAHLRQNYYDCFFVPMSGKYVPPYESALRSYQEKPKPSFGQLNTALTAQVKQQYGLTGFDPYSMDVFPPLKNIPLVDHVGFELAYMAYLCQLENEARKESQGSIADKWFEIQKEFLSKHLLLWIPSLVGALGTLEKGFYYQGTKVLASWLNEDYQEVKKYSSKGGICVEC